MLLGCDSGNLRLLALTDAEHGLAHPPARIAQMEMHQYQGALLPASLCQRPSQHRVWACAVICIRTAHEE